MEMALALASDENYDWKFPKILTCSSMSDYFTLLIFFVDGTVSSAIYYINKKLFGW